MTFIHPVTQKQIPDSLTGVIVPLFTPVDSNGRIDRDGLKAYADLLANDPAITTLFWRSGVGRMYSYSMEEVKLGLDIVLESVAGRKPVLCGAAGIYDGDFQTKTDPKKYLDDSIELASFSKERGVEGIVLVIPAGLPVDSGSTPQDVTYKYLKAVHDAVDIPILMYNPQALPKEYHSTPNLIRKVSALPRVIGMKLSTTDMYWMGNLIEAAGENDFVMIAGSECTYYQALMTGAAGVVGQGCSVYPGILRRILDTVVSGDWAAALRAQFDVNRALEGFQNLEADISGFAYLRKKGLQVTPYCRNGSSPLEETAVDAIFDWIDPINQDYL